MNTLQKRARKISPPTISDWPSHNQVRHMNHTTRLFLALSVAFVAWDMSAADDVWPALPVEKLIFKETDRHTQGGTKVEKVDILRGTNRIAQVQKIDRNGDGKIREFAFSAFIAGQRVFVLSRLGGTNESSQFFSCDDAMVMGDLRFPESKSTALVVVSKRHGWYEIFTRHADGYYWPAEEESRKVVDAYFRKGAEIMAPFVKKLEN